jgi:hypothetical protein
LARVRRAVTNPFEPSEEVVRADQPTLQRHVIELVRVGNFAPRVEFLVAVPVLRVVYFHAEAANVGEAADDGPLTTITL